MNEITTTMHSVKLSVNNDYIGNDGTLDEKKAEEKVAAVRDAIKDMTAIELWQKIVESEIGDSTGDVLCGHLMDTILGFKETFDDGKWQNDECYTEVSDDYVAENAEVRYIDAWKSDDDEVPGISACVIINGIPYYRNCEAMTSPKVAEVVARYDIK